MKLMTAILLLGFCGAAWAQNPDVSQDTRTTMKLVQQKKALDSDAALAASQPNASKPAPSQPAKAASESNAFFCCTNFIVVRVSWITSGFCAQAAPQDPNKRIAVISFIGSPTFSSLLVCRARRVRDHD